MTPVLSGMRLKNSSCKWRAPEIGKLQGCCSEAPEPPYSSNIPDMLGDLCVARYAYQLPRQKRLNLFLSAAFCQFGSSSSETYLCWSHVALCLVQIVQISQSHQKNYKPDAKLSPVCHFGSYRFAQPVILLFLSLEEYIKRPS